jgi:hypothetical protein
MNNHDDVVSPRTTEEYRHAALDAVLTAYVHDKLTLQDYENRVDAIQKATTQDTIRVQVSDLPLSFAPLDSARPVATRDQAAGQEKPTFALCIMGERKLTGDWLKGRGVISMTVMGETRIDLRNTMLPPGILKIQAFAVMGEIDIHVPKGVPVRMNVVPFMGEAHMHRSAVERNDADRHSSIADTTGAAPGSPGVSVTIEISGLALMGSINVKAV